MVRYSLPALDAPETAVRLWPEIVAASWGKYPAWQSPTMLQSDAGVVASNLGTGALGDAIARVETGANETLS
jgi:hypothetical protein